MCFVFSKEVLLLTLLEPHIGEKPRTIHLTYNYITKTPYFSNS